jgi:hypothetical protein
VHLDGVCYTKRALGPNYQGRPTDEIHRRSSNCSSMPNLSNLIAHEHQGMFEFIANCPRQARYQETMRWPEVLSLYLRTILRESSDRTQKGKNCFFPCLSQLCVENLYNLWYTSSSARAYLDSGTCDFFEAGSTHLLPDDELSIPQKPFRKSYRSLGDERGYVITYRDNRPQSTSWAPMNNLRFRSVYNTRHRDLCIQPQSCTSNHSNLGPKCQPPIDIIHGNLRYGIQNQRLFHG